MSMDTLEISVNKIQVIDNCSHKDTVNAVLIANWNLPRGNIAVVTKTLSINQITAKFNKDFSAESYLNRALFKEQREGTSGIRFELVVTQTPGIMEKIVAGVLDKAVSKLSGPYAGTVLDLLLERLGIDEKKAISIGKGEVEISGADTDCLKEIKLSIPKRIYVHEEEGSFSDQADQSGRDVRQIDAGTTNGTLVIEINRL